jgi:hypothetical protein
LYRNDDVWNPWLSCLIKVGVLDITSFDCAFGVLCDKRYAGFRFRKINSVLVFRYDDKADVSSFFISIREINLNRVYFFEIVESDLGFILSKILSYACLNLFMTDIFSDSADAWWVRNKLNILTLFSTIVNTLTVLFNENIHSIFFPDWSLICYDELPLRGIFSYFLMSINQST